MSRKGIDVASAAEFVGQLPPEGRARVRVVPDRDLPAGKLVALGRALRAAGAKQVAIVTQRGLE